MMIKAHFTQSQFLVVSHKEGMFNNANVIFRVALVDGASQVTRSVPTSKIGTGAELQQKPAAAKGKKGSTASKAPLGASNAVAA